MKLFLRSTKPYPCQPLCHSFELEHLWSLQACLLQVFIRVVLCSKLSQIYWVNHSVVFSSLFVHHSIAVHCRGNIIILQCIALWIHHSIAVHCRGNIVHTLCSFLSSRRCMHPYDRHMHDDALQCTLQWTALSFNVWWCTWWCIPMTDICMMMHYNSL